MSDTTTTADQLSYADLAAREADPKVTPVEIVDSLTMAEEDEIAGLFGNDVNVLPPAKFYRAAAFAIRRRNMPDEKLSDAFKYATTTPPSVLTDLFDRQAEAAGDTGEDPSTPVGNGEPEPSSEPTDSPSSATRPASSRPKRGA